MENIKQKIAEIIAHTHKTPLEQADEILLLFSVSGQSEQLSCDTCVFNTHSWSEYYPCATCNNFDKHKAT